MKWLWALLAVGVVVAFLLFFRKVANASPVQRASAPPLGAGGSSPWANGSTDPALGPSQNTQSLSAAVLPAIDGSQWNVSAGSSAAFADAPPPPPPPKLVSATSTLIQPIPPTTGVMKATAPLVAVSNAIASLKTSQAALVAAVAKPVAYSVVSSGTNKSEPVPTDPKLQSSSTSSFGSAVALTKAVAQYASTLPPPPPPPPAVGWGNLFGGNLGGLLKKIA